MHPVNIHSQKILLKGQQHLLLEQHPGLLERYPWLLCIGKLPPSPLPCYSLVGLGKVCLSHKNSKKIHDFLGVLVDFCWIQE